MVAWLFLAASLVGAAFTLSAWLRLRPLGFLRVPYFFAGWLTGELVLHHLAWQFLATIAFVVFGALDAWPGLLGLAVTAASWAGLVALQHRASKAADVLERALRQALGDEYQREVAYMTRSRGWSSCDLSGPVTPVASVPPMVARPGRGGSTARNCPCWARTP